MNIKFIKQTIKELVLNKKALENIDKKKHSDYLSDLIIDNLPKTTKSPTIYTTSSFMCRWSIKNKNICEIPLKIWNSRNFLF